MTDMKTICVMGLGYIGLPTASVLASSGFRVLGVDVNPRVVGAVNSGAVPINEPGLQTVVHAAIVSGNLRAALTPERADVFIIAVPTPITFERKADMSHVIQAAEGIAQHLELGSLVILESTSPPGTCTNVLTPILERTGLKVGKDVSLAYCPERVLPGRILRELIENERVIGGCDPESALRAREIYATFVEGGIHLTDAVTAEMVKLMENTFRDVNVALANEMALICEHLGVDFWEATPLANRHPRVEILSAGPGVGGHCIPVDPWFLVEQCPKISALIRQARERNDSMPAHVVELTLAIVSGIAIPKIGILGLAFKGNVNDIRKSPALEVVRILSEKGLEVAVHDSHVRDSPISLSSIEQCCEKADCLLVLTEHEDYRRLVPAQVAQWVRRRSVFDTRNVLDHESWREAGFEVRVLGCGRAPGGRA